MTKEVVSAQDVTIEFDGGRCIHSRSCVLIRPDVFVPNVKGAWIHPERASVAEVVEIAHNCPSGAIQCHKSDGSGTETIIGKIDQRDVVDLNFIIIFVIDDGNFIQRCGIEMIALNDIGQ